MTGAPWSTQRKLKATAIMAGFVCLTSSLIGYGIYSLNHQHKLSVNRQTILGLLTQDSGFVRALNQAAISRTCRNTTLRFEVTYLPPLHPIATDGEFACLQFITTHPTGQQIMIQISHQREDRTELVQEYTQRFEYAKSDLRTDRKPVSRISGVRDKQPSTVYILEATTGSWIVDYAPTSPTVDGKVEALALSLVESY